MIAQAFPSSHCTCFDPWGAVTPKPPCPEHGDLFTAPATAAPGKVPAMPSLTKQVNDAAYTRGRVAGFKEGFDAAVAMLGA